MSPYCKEIFGYDPAEFLGKKSGVTYIEDQDMTKEALTKALAGESGSNLEYRIQIKNGEIKWVSHSWKNISYGGKVSMIISTIRDITQRKSMEKALLDKNNELQAFVYTVSHDLKNPLVSMYGFMDRLMEKNREKFDKESMHFAERIFANVKHMEALIHALLELSRVGISIGKRKEIDVEELFRDIALRFSPMLEKNEIEMTFSVPEKTVINANGEQMNQVMDNLVGNAIKFMGDSKERRIKLLARKEHGKVKIAVQDTGIGIDPQHHGKIFEIFQRLGETNNKTEGTGVGLTLVKKIIEGHGGQVKVISEKGHGAEFLVEMPQ